MMQDMSWAIEVIEEAVAPHWSTNPRLWYELGMDGIIDLMRMVE